MTDTRQPAAPLYAHGADHYRSPNRRDFVKRHIEEPVSHRVYDHAVRALGKPAGDTLTVVDLGCGTGDGIDLITEPHPGYRPVADDYELHYHGIDLDPNMISAARDTHPEATSYAEFTVGDMRDSLPDHPIDMVMSCGVPYSHLTPDEIEDVVEAVFDHIRRHRTRTTVVIDILGRYSIEWPTKWDEQRWPYTMSFFEGGRPPIRDDMTHMCPDSLRPLISRAAATAGVHVEDITMTDRSVAVGRHTSTREFNPTIAPYRDLVNALHDGQPPSCVNDLRLPHSPSDATAPPAVTDFFHRFTRTWNRRLDALNAAEPRDTAALARSLVAMETAQRPGRGVGHSLLTTVTVDATD